MTTKTTGAVDRMTDDLRPFGCRLADTPSRSLADVEAVWRDLEQRAEPNPFLTFEWARSWWECFGEGHELHILLLEEEAEGVVGLVPLMRSSQRTAFGWRWSTLRFIGHSVSDRLGFVCADRHRSRVAASVAGYLRTHRSRWDVLQLHNLPQGSPEITAFVSEFAATHAVMVEPGQRCPYLPIVGSWDAFLRSRSSNFRSELRRSRRRIERELGGRFVAYSEPEGLREALSFLFQHNVERFADDGGSAFANPRTRSFHFSLASRMLAAGRLACQVLEIEGKPAAVVYSFRHGNIVWYYNTAFDPRWSAWGPGKVALGHAVQDAFESGATEFDFLLGDHAYKRRWTDEARQHHHVIIVTRRPLALLVAAAPRWIIALKRRLKTVVSNPP